MKARLRFKLSSDNLGYVADIGGPMRKKALLLIAHSVMWISLVTELTRM